MLLEVADRFVKFLCGMDNQGVVPPGLHSPAAASPGGGGTAGGDRRRDGGSGQDKDPRAGFPQASGFVPVSSKLNLNVNLTKLPNEVSATTPFKHGDSMSPRRTLIFQNVGMKSKKCQDTAPHDKGATGCCADGQKLISQNVGTNSKNTLKSTLKSRSQETKPEKSFYPPC